MYGIKRNTGARLWALALVAAWTPSAARADVLHYNTSAVLDRGTPPATSAGTISGENAVGFLGVTDGTLDPSAPLRLGEFVITPVGSGTTTYTHTPFDIEVDVPALSHWVPNDGSPEPGPHIDSVVVHGYLDGAVTPGGSHLTATVDSVQAGTTSLGPFAAVPYYYDFPIAPESIRVTSPLVMGVGGNGGSFALTAQVPEPSAAAAFALALAGLGLWRRGHKRPFSRNR